MPRFKQYKQGTRKYKPLPPHGYQNKKSTKILDTRKDANMIENNYKVSSLEPLGLIVYLVRIKGDDRLYSVDLV